MGEIVGDNVHPPTLEEQTPEFLSSTLEAGCNMLCEYGWYILIFSLALYYLWIKKIKPANDKWKKQMDDKSYAAKYHKDPALFQAIQETIEANRRKMQEELEIKSRQYLEKQKEAENANRLERIADWERHEKGLGYRSKMKSREEESPGTSSQKQVKSTLKPEYNPLMGPGSSSGYRPPKRSCCSGGGCG